MKKEDKKDKQIKELQAEIEKLKILLREEREFMSTKCDKLRVLAWEIYKEANMSFPLIKEHL